jgi:arylsulfatase A-like enzyme
VSLALWPALLVAAAAARAEAPRPRKPLNVVVVGADTLRADHLSLYGYERPTTPNIDRLAARGCVFEKAFAQGSYTLPSFASFFTSLYPEQHGATSRITRIRDSAETLAEVFSRAGYRTAGFTGGPFVAFPYGFAKGFDSYLSGDLPRPLEAYVPAALDWIDADRSKPFFLFLQPQDVHPPFDALALPKTERDRWDPGDSGPIEKYLGSYYFYHQLNLDADELAEDGYGPPPSPALKAELDAVRRDRKALRRLASVYDDRVARLDRSFAALWKRLEDRGLLENTVVVLMSDHGTLLGEGGRFAHGDHLSTLDAVFHVALVVWAPGRGAARVGSPVELIDAAPTILELAGLASPPAFEGRSLVPLMAGGKRDAPDAPVFGDAVLVSNESPVRRFVRDGRWLLTVDDPGAAKALYDLAADPGQTKDVSRRNPAETGRLSGILARHLQRVERPE